MAQHFSFPNFKIGNFFINVFYFSFFFFSSYTLLFKIMHICYNMPWSRNYQRLARMPRGYVIQTGMDCFLFRFCIYVQNGANSTEGNKNFEASIRSPHTGSRDRLSIEGRNVNVRHAFPVMSFLPLPLIIYAATSVHLF